MKSFRKISLSFNFKVGSKKKSIEERDKELLVYYDPSFLINRNRESS